MPTTRTRLSHEEIAGMANLFKVLSEENRLRILWYLRGGERCVCTIWQDLDLPQNLASYHLKTLAELGLITSRKEGLRVYYSLNRENNRAVLGILSHILR